ncbi:hemerythrin family protein [Candidatus Sulfurimonas marisnigri]|uniref:Hemerythrin family protein n=1 Tax=Candidatus Sulfurimonas marisnigri TaxID=2740405 RepID=A0A7S7LZ88_9BACT|nr:hemerythrin family protein [Candidatus Sulfurimonas marisnigri]QOY53598.1 hemerythrin family protein [Candidatus Sulfurimonas marisnigri]
MMTQEQLPMVAIPSMNNTHLEEMLIINKLETAARDNDTGTVSKILEELLKHTVMHFVDEEDMMEKGLFPDFNTHKSEHDRHLHELKSLLKYFEKNKDTKAILVYIEGALTPWLIHHMETMDTVMATYIQAESSTKGSTT